MRRTLAPATAELKHDFGRISSVRELPDGTVLVSDGIDNVIVSADFATQRVSQVGRRGNGPGEYANAGVLHALAHDTTLATDVATRRWTLLAGNRIVGTIPTDNPAVIAARGQVMGTSRDGRIATAFYEAVKPGTRQIGISDSLEIVIVDFHSGLVDTVAKARRMLQTETSFDLPDGRSARFTARQAFSATEGFDIGPDGWVVIARLNPYRVDWIAPTGTMVRGPVIPYEPVKVTEREKEFHRNRFPGQLNGPRSFPSGITDKQKEVMRTAYMRQFTDFPDYLPPFSAPSVVTVSEAAAFILRTPSAERPGHLFDVVDHTGRLIARIQMQRGERIIGVGKNAVYVAAEDEDGLDHLRKHPWP